MINWSQYPLVLKKSHVKEILGVGDNVTYALLNQKGFPSVRVGRSFRVSRDSLKAWIEQA